MKYFLRLCCPGNPEVPTEIRKGHLTEVSPYSEQWIYSDQVHYGEFIMVAIDKTTMDSVQ